MNDNLKLYAKAIVAFIAPGVVGLVAAVQDGSQGGSNITGPEWVGIAAACVLTSAGVYVAPYTRPAKAAAPVVAPVDPNKEI